LKALALDKPYSRSEATMPRRPAVITQADVARAIRAAKQAGAEAVELRPDGTIIVVLKNTQTVPDENPPEPPKREIIM
jgi:hypothetical protein